MARPAPTALLARLARGIPFAGLDAYFAAVSAQHAIPARSRTRLAGDLTRARRASGSRRRAALRTLIRDASATQGQAALTLRFAAQGVR